MKKFLLFLTLSLTLSLSAQNYQFLGPITANGTPLYLQPNDVISPATLTLINNSLPSSHPVPVYNPQYISAGYDTDVKIMEAADVYVTYVTEGASYLNVLGFYTYNLTNPPTTAPTTSQITIIFPNVSAVNSGGSLVAGNKVKIGTFPAGTGIGWVLIANGWNGTQVTNGLWRLFSNPSFNPEVNPSLKPHTVLLKDVANQRVIVGFEDIKRDLSNCDHDFNDVVFYVTASPYKSINTDNVADITDATDVSSGNNGGLESEGSLATLIAKRNFKRMKENSFQDKKKLQKTFEKNTASAGRDGNNGSAAALSSYFPSTGMFGTETASISSPTDLVEITNADEVFAADYYQGQTRVAAALATKTTGTIYNHTKVICDRLNNSILEDLRTVTMNGYEIIMSKIRRENGDVEYTIGFSIQKLTSGNKVHSYWNIAQYPTGNFTNYQVWGASMGQVSSIANYILNQYNLESTLTEDAVANRVPTVFVKKATYKDGKAKLTIINKTGATSVAFIGNKKNTELSGVENTTFNSTISADYESQMELNVGNLFDIGFTIQGSNSPQMDALYLADGPWGLDYIETETTISSFQITNPATTPIDGVYNIERNAAVVGQVKGTSNLFRNILPGELLFNTTNYNAVQFAIQNSMAVEVVLVTENTTDWNNRLRFQIPANVNLNQISIALQDFTSPNGLTFENEKIRGFVFSVIGNYVQFQPYSLSVNDMKMTQGTLGSTEIKPVIQKMYNYPNPFMSETTIVLSERAASAQVKLIDLVGRTVQEKTYTVNQNNEINFINQNAPKGMYIMVVTTDTQKQYQQKVLVK